MKIFICEDDPKQRENMVTIIKNLYNDRRKAYGNCPRN